MPDPSGAYGSWAERFRTPVRDVLTELGVPVREISQTERYRGGVYTGRIGGAMRHRRHIHDVLARYRTKARATPIDPESSYLYRVYCRVCGRDGTTITTYADDTTHLAYRCADCGNHDELVLAEAGSGTLVWKVDWPMRWAHDRVTFEAAGRTTPHPVPR